MFYIIVPFIVKKTKTILILIAASLVLKAIMTAAGLTNDPWSYRFFPTEMYLFCGGIIAFNLYKTYKAKINLKLAKVISFLFIALIIIYNYLSIPSLALYATFILALPFIFAYSKNFKFDRKTGELSYPIYLSHLLIITSLEKIGFFKNLNHNYHFLLFFPLVLIFSIFLVKFIQDPIDKIRDYNTIKDSFYSKLLIFALEDEAQKNQPPQSQLKTQG